MGKIILPRITAYELLREGLLKVWSMDHMVSVLYVVTSPWSDKRETEHLRGSNFMSINSDNKKTGLYFLWYFKISFFY